MKKILSLALALAMMLSLAACGGDSSGTKTDGSGDNSVSERTEVLTLRLGALGSGREDDIQSYPIRAFIDYVEEKTNGMIKIQYFPDGQLGQEGDMMDQVLTDDLDIGVLSAKHYPLPKALQYCEAIPRQRVVVSCGKSCGDIAVNC